MAQIDLTNLVPGKTYTVMVQAKDADGNHSGNSQMYTFTVPGKTLSGTQLSGTNSTVVTALASPSGSAVGGALVAGGLDATGIATSGSVDLGLVWNATLATASGYPGLTGTSSVGAVMINSTGILGYQFASASSATTSSGQANFYLSTKDGNAYFRGTIYSGAGLIGGWNINNSGIYRNYTGYISSSSFTYNASVSVLAPTSVYSDFITDYTTSNDGSAFYSSYLKLGNTSVTFLNAVQYDIPLPRLEMQWNLGSSIINTMSINGLDGYVYESYDSTAPTRSRVWMGYIDSGFSTNYGLGFGIHAKTNSSPGTLRIQPAVGGIVQVGPRVFVNSNSIYTQTDASNIGPYPLAISPQGNLTLNPVGNVYFTQTGTVDFGALSIGSTSTGTINSTGGIALSATTDVFLLPGGTSNNLKGNGNIYNSTPVSTRSLYIGTSPYVIGTTTSSRRVKQQISDFQWDVNSVLNMVPKKFKYNAHVEEFGDENSPWIYGLIAEEVGDLGLEGLINRDDDGIPDYVAYEKISLALLAVVQDQQKTIENLEQRLALLENK